LLIELTLPLNGFSVFFQIVVYLNFNKMKKIKFFVIFALISFASTVRSQTDVDGIMMGKRNICGGLVYGYSSWSKYWEGQTLRTNENIGTVSSNSVWAMVNYGISDRLNVIAMVPYISNNASAGTLIGHSGLQDASLIVKWDCYGSKFKKFFYNFIAFGGFSTPTTNYVADYLPLSIGLQSSNLMGKLMVDIQKDHWFATLSANATSRSNVTIDRDAYYTTELIYSNQVQMPTVLGYNLRWGYRKDADLIVESVFDCMNTIGGYDIRKNDMPFLSNNMDIYRIGINLKLPIPLVNGLSFTANNMYTISGRNMGKATSFMAGILYQTEFAKRTK
jgi:hypothetical protein